MRQVHDPIHEGIVLAIEGVHDIMRDDHVSFADAVRKAKQDVEATWVFEPYGVEEDLVRNACRSQLNDMAKGLDG